jgi:hypothetical protein
MGAVSLHKIGQLSLLETCCGSGSGAFLTPGFGMGKKSGSGIRIRDEQTGSYFREPKKQFFWVKILKFFDADPRSGM